MKNRINDKYNKNKHDNWLINFSNQSQMYTDKMKLFKYFLFFLFFSASSILGLIFLREKSKPKDFASKFYKWLWVKKIAQGPCHCIQIFNPPHATLQMSQCLLQCCQMMTLKNM